MTECQFEIHHGTALEVLQGFDEDSVDAVVTDPPSGTGFLGEEWDTDKGGRDEWIEWLRRIQEELRRVVKPGGHQLAWALPRTSHWTGMGIELGGWEVRDQLEHIFGTGYPKSLKIDAAIDKLREDECEHVRAFLLEARDRARMTNRDIDDAFGFNGMACHWISHPTQPSLPTPDQWLELKAMLELGTEMDEEVARLNARKGEFGDDWKERPITGTVEEWKPGVAYSITSADGMERAQAVSDRSKDWEGWGTWLRPAHEVWWLARNPLTEKSIARQVLKTSTGAINVMGTGDGKHSPNLLMSHSPNCDQFGCLMGACPVFELGRRATSFPIFRYQLKPGRQEKDDGLFELEDRILHRVNPGGLENDPKWAPVSVKNHHPTVKSLELMRWHIRLVARPGDTVLDMFTGSGTGGVAALLEGCRFVGIEKDEDFADIARARLGFAALDIDERHRQRAVAAHTEGQGFLWGAGEGG